MKRVWRKLRRHELLFDYILFILLSLVSGSLLIVQIVKIAVQTSLPARDTYFTVFYAAASLVVVILAGFSLYKKFSVYIMWYKEIFNAVPIPLIVTGEEVEWQQINTAARNAIDLKDQHNLENMNSRHLVASDGSFKNRTWFYNGKNYQVAGEPLSCGGKRSGYLIYLVDVLEMSESDKIQAEKLHRVHKYIKSISAETEYLRGCASNISGHMIWQSNTISDLLETVDEVVSGNLRDPRILSERVYAIKSDIQKYTKKSQADLDKLQSIIRELKKTDGYGENRPHNEDTA